MSVHLFIMYYAILSCITPPVAVGSFLAASVAGAPPMKTAWQSMRLGIVIYIIPLFFLYQPSLILQEGSIYEFLFHFLTCLVGIFILSCGVEGYAYWVGEIGKGVRTMMFIGGLLMAAPNPSLTIVGFALFFLAYAFSYYKKRSTGKEKLQFIYSSYPDAGSVKTETTEE